MVDTIGSGIKRMFNFQRLRFFPMPEYQLAENKVTVTIIGKVLDIDYARVLAQIPSLTLEEIMMLDKVQKKSQLSDFEINRLREKKLIEGRKPNFYISVMLAKATGQKAAYSKNKGLNKGYYHDLIVKAISDHGSLSRKDIDDLVWEKLPDIYDVKQKKVKINNLITELSRKGKIRNKGNDRNSVWVSNNELNN